MPDRTGVATFTQQLRCGPWFSAASLTGISPPIQCTAQAPKGQAVTVAFRPVPEARTRIGHAFEAVPAPPTARRSPVQNQQFACRSSVIRVAISKSEGQAAEDFRNSEKIVQENRLCLE